MKELPNPTFALSPVAMPQVIRGSLCPSGQTVVSDVVQRPAVGKISVSWARHQDEVRAAQRLRYQVFALEMGATLPVTVPGHDIDLFDDYCEHLLVRDEASGDVIGTYRVLTPTQAKRAGSAQPPRHTAVQVATRQATQRHPLQPKTEQGAERGQANAGKQHRLHRCSADQNQKQRAAGGNEDGGIAYGAVERAEQWPKRRLPGPFGRAGDDTFRPLAQPEHQRTGHRM